MARRLKKWSCLEVRVAICFLRAKNVSTSEIHRASFLEAILRKSPGMFSDGAILLHDNVKPHTARKTQELLQKFKWEVWSHPPYSSDLASIYYFYFPKLKEHLSTARFSSNCEVKTAAEN
ncbi:hypothetical protein AVEN_80585-1 [Araneus ventricosus]|uniref:Tc1-like transposase DDE domain-containing protein n=1 Tax=Araneus ventricosus TaxID=182803 RepID=A0A4Y2PNF2_ARAVE|nr:hypothetical protein AVEN_80585-1 [Araneus ventricosus]